MNTLPNRTESAPAQQGKRRLGPLSLAVGAAFKDLRADIEIVEQRIASRLDSDAEILSEIAHYLHQLGGKRIRPIFTLLSSRLFKMAAPSSALVDVAAGIEMIHMATLLHDDIIDKSVTRRHKESAYHKFGLTPTLLTGDFLLVSAFGLCAQLDLFVIKATERACIELTEGEVLEGSLDPRDPISFEAYIDIIEKKTATLFSLSAAVGAFTAGATEQQVQTMYRFGRKAGIAFQMVDDILDITADEDLLGKPSGTDLKQQTPSLINILWLKSGDPEAMEFFSRSNVTIEDAKVVADKLRVSPVVEQARAIAKQYANEANALLCSLDKDAIDSRALNHFLAIIEYTLDRCL